MTVDEARALLSACTRAEIQDHRFDDTEVYWEDLDGQEVASGYFDTYGGLVTIGENRFPEPHATELRALGRRADITLINEANSGAAE